MILLGIQTQDYNNSFERWDKWCRLNCPTTTNSFDSIYHHINANIPFKGIFYR